MAAIGEVQGIAAMQEALRMPELEAQLQAGLRQEAERIAEEARQALLREHPGGTGALAASVEVGENGRSEAASFSVGTPSEIGRYVEFGTRFMPASPWLMPAFRARLPAIKQALARLLATAFADSRS